jgi:flagellar protein FliO/FliZ
VKICSGRAYTGYLIIREGSVLAHSLRGKVRTGSATRLRVIFCALVFIILLTPALCFVQETDPSEIAPSSPTETQTQPPEQEVGQTAAPDYEYEEPEFGENRLSYPMLVLRTIAVLAVIVVGIYLVFRFLLKKRHPFTRESEIIKVLASFQIAANKSIQIVEIAEKMLVLGVSDSNINLITTIEEKETIDRIRLLSSKESQGGGSFRDQFLKIIGGKSFPKSSQISYLDGYKKRINKMKKL